MGAVRQQFRAGLAGALIGGTGLVDRRAVLAADAAEQIEVARRRADAIAPRGRPCTR